MKNKYTIGITLNDVIRDNTKALIEYYEQDFGDLTDEVKEKVNFHYPTKSLFSSKEEECDFIYNETLFQIFAISDVTYDNISNDIDAILDFFENDQEYSNIELIIISKENRRTKPATLQFLAKIFSRFNKYIFVKKESELFNHCDCIVTSNEKLVKYKNKNKSLILFERPYNKETSIKGVDLKIKRLNQIINPNFLDHINKNG